VGLNQSRKIEIGIFSRNCWVAEEIPDLRLLRREAQSWIAE